MKKKKIILGLGLLSLSAFTLASCNNANFTNVDNSTSNSTITTVNTSNVNTTTENTPIVTIGTNRNSTTLSDSMTSITSTTTANNIVPTTTVTTINTTTTTINVVPTTTTTNNVVPTTTTTNNVVPTTTTTNNVVPTTTTTTTQQGEINNQTGIINFISANGDFEDAYVTFNGINNATSYNAYVSSDNANWTKLDQQLTREYTDNGKKYYRTDAVGLKTGNYSIKVVPVINGSEDSSKANIAKNINVLAHDRSGFAFVNGSSSGAYNDDGTLKANANVLYITNDNIDTVELDVTTDSKGKITSCTGITEILLAYKKNYETKPLNIRVLGVVSNDGALTTDTQNFAGDLAIKGAGKEDSKKLKCGITIEGIGDDATALGWGVRIANASNVEVRNLGFMLCDSDEGDNVGLQQDNDHIWVHNCDMFYGKEGKDKDQVKGDGALDCKLSTYVSFSYNHFFDSGKCNLLGLKEKGTDGFYITYHHNWYDHSDSRHPRVRFFSAHVYNNYYDGNSKYGIGATSGSSIFAEKNYFRNCKYPMMISMQGTDVYGTGTKYDAGNNGTFSTECGGIIKAFSNHIEGAASYLPYNSTNSRGIDTTYEFDAYEVSNSKDQIPDTVKANMGQVKTKGTSLKNTVNGINYGNTYNNFDTQSTMYLYQADDVLDVPTIVKTYAGRINGGDFKWTFNNDVDDTSYEVNVELKQAIVSYSSKLTKVFGIN